MQRSKTGLILWIALVIIAWGKAISYGQVTVKVPKITTTPGTRVAVPVLVSDLAGYDILSYQFKVLYDSMVVAATGITVENTLTAEWGNAVVNLDKAGQMVIGAFGIHELTGRDTLIKLNFDVIAGPGDSSKISLREFSFNNNKPEAITEDGVIKISSLARVADNSPGDLPATPRLICHYPEPLRDHASFRVRVMGQRTLTVEIRNLLGQRVRMFEIPNHGLHELSFDWEAQDERGQIVAPGIYFCMVRQGGFMLGVEKMTVIR